MRTNQEEKDLIQLILSILANNYSCANDIMCGLKAKELEFEVNKFYPTLSNLQLRNMLCTNWLKNDNGENIKYYHITRNGFNHIHQHY